MARAGITLTLRDRTSDEDIRLPRVLSGLGTIVSAVGEECLSTWRRPQRILKIADAVSWRRVLHYHRIRLTAAKGWEPVGNTRLTARRIASYDEYLALQKSKLEFLDLATHEQSFRRVLRARVADLPFVERGGTVLCLGARLGAEVAAFLDCGCFAVGVDLNPGIANPYVVAGDFHALQFADRCVDIVYSNSIDHAFDLKKLSAEVRRVLKPGGHLILEIDPGTRERPELDGDLWQALAWEVTGDLVAAVCAEGFSAVSQRPFDYPRGGTQAVFRPTAT